MLLYLQIIVLFAESLNHIKTSYFKYNKNDKVEIISSKPCQFIGLKHFSLSNINKLKVILVCSKDSGQYIIDNSEPMLILHDSYKINAFELFLKEMNAKIKTNFDSTIPIISILTNYIKMQNIFPRKVLLDLLPNCYAKDEKFIAQNIVANKVLSLFTKFVSSQFFFLDLKLLKISIGKDDMIKGHFFIYLITKENHEYISNIYEINELSNFRFYLDKVDLDKKKPDSSSKPKPRTKESGFFVTIIIIIIVICVLVFFLVYYFIYKADPNSDGN
ncbi:hypothetical protein NUSPORA_01687 [Nucleospora cyclopteri]